MKVSEFLLALFQQGITVQLDQENLKIIAPKGALSSEIQRQLLEEKAEIISYLRDAQAVGYKNSHIRRVDRSQPISASFAQQGLWLQYQLEGPSNTYNVPYVYKVSGELNIRALEDSLKYLITRHDAFRTSFKSIDGELYQLIADSVDWKLEIHEVDEETAERELRDIASKPFSFEQAPLMRAHLWKHSENEFTFLFNIHHIVFDEWSQGVFERELSQIYSQYDDGLEANLPPTELDYADFADWQRSWLQEEELDRQLAYWKESLKGAPQLLELPTDHPRSPVRTYRGHTIWLDCDPSILEKLQKLALGEQVTLFMVMNSAFAVLLGRYSHQEDMVIGFPITNRQRKELESMLGFFVNMLPLRVDLSGNPTLSELLQRIRGITLDAYENYEVPFEKIVARVLPQRNLQFSPIFQVVFQVGIGSSQSLRLGRCAVLPENVGDDFGISKYDIRLLAHQEEKNLRLKMEYNSDIFDPATMERMLAHYVRILEWMVSKPVEGINEFDLLSVTEREQILVKWNDTVTNYPREKCIHQLFEEHAQRDPDSTAVIFGERQLTYKELNERANQLAHSLCEIGICPEIRVGMYMERSIEMIVTLLAILKAGGVYVPLDTTYPPERQAFILRDTEAQVLLTLRQHIQSLPDFDGNVLCVDDEELYTGKSEENLNISVAPENLAYIMYTSGSTGLPKGIGIPHRAVVRLVKDTNYARFDPEEIFLQFAPLAFDASTFEIWGSLLNGAALVIFPPHLPGLDELSRFVEAEGITTLWLTSGLFHQMIESQPSFLNNLHQLLSGGDVLSPSHVRLALQQNPNCRLINAYGPTENTTFTCCCSISDLNAERSVPIGRPIANSSVYILDAYGQPVPIGVVGELYVGGDGLAREYLNQPELTEQYFVPNPFSDQVGARLFRTGDFVRWLPDGNIEFLGRKDDQVKIRGYRIELGEINAVLEKLPEIKQAHVVKREDQAGAQRLVAYVVSTSGSNPDADKLRLYLREKLPDYMIPSTFVSMDAFPLTVNGKVDRKALPQPELEPRIDRALAPRSEIETRLTSIWKEILGVDTVGIKDDFFELGGNSLLAMRLLGRIQADFGQSLPVQLMFKDGTVEALAKFLTNLDKPQVEQGIVPIKPEGSKLPLFLLFPNLDLRELALALDPERPVFGLNPIENGKMVYRKSVQETAKILYHDLVPSFPKEPFSLIAHSAFGFFAVELARLLIQSGKEVAFLGMLDTYPPMLSRKLDPVDWANFYTDNLPYINLPEVLRYFGSSIRRLSPRWMKRVKMAALIKRYEKEAKYDEVRSLLIRGYNPEPFDGKVILFSATNRLFDFGENPMEQWTKTFTGQLEFVSIPGDHFSILKSPHVSVLAGEIEARLPQAPSALSLEHK